MNNNNNDSDDEDDGDNNNNNNNNISQSLPFNFEFPGLIPGQYMWGLWWMKGHWDMLSLGT
jgi:hypothetical protein